MTPGANTPGKFGGNSNDMLNGGIYSTAPVGGTPLVGGAPIGGAPV